MQTMPNKTRNAVAIGAVLLALAVGGFALWSGRTDTPEPQQAENPATLPTDPADTAATGNDPDATEPVTAANGSTLTPATGTPAITGETASVPETHVVKEGETLRTIAQKYYNDAAYAGDIETLNEIENPDHITAGTELKLPRPDDLHQEEDNDE